MLPKLICYFRCNVCFLYFSTKSLWKSFKDRALTVFVSLASAKVRQDFILTKDLQEKIKKKCVFCEFRDFEEMFWWVRMAILNTTLYFTHPPRLRRYSTDEQGERLIRSFRWDFLKKTIYYILCMGRCEWSYSKGQGTSATSSSTSISRFGKLSWRAS